MRSLFIQIVNKSAVALMLCMAVPGIAQADFPEHEITVVVPWPPGGSTDQITRALAEAAEKELGQTVIVVNKPGASSTLAMTELANTEPDGYTLGVMSTSSILQPLQGRGRYDVVEDFAHILHFADSTIGIVVQDDSDITSFDELIERGKSDPGALKYGTSGVGSVQHLVMEGVQADTGAKFVHIPQGGGNESVTALLGGHVDFINEVTTWAPHVEAGTLRPLVLTTAQRVSEYPDVPTLSEKGFETVRSVQIIVAPAGIPEQAQEALEQAFLAATSSHEFQQAMDRLRMQTLTDTGAQARETVGQQQALSKELLSILEN